MPWVVFNSFKISIFGPYIFMSIVAFLSTIAAFLMPMDTAG